MSTFEVDDCHFLSFGHFKDVRDFPSFSFTGQSFKSGALHDIEIRALIKIPELVIEDIEVAIITVPRGDCRTLENSLDSVIGLSISRGFTEKVKSLAGGNAGCTHLVHLLTTMAPAILQGYWALLDRKKSKSGEALIKRASSSARYLKNSCYTWREDGEAFLDLLDITENGLTR